MPGKTWNVCTRLYGPLEAWYLEAWRRELNNHRVRSRQQSRTGPAARTGEPELPLFLGATALTAVNDNALITYLATLAPNLSDELKFAVVQGAVVGGGLTVIANAPNPAGQALLGRFFDGAISPLGLLAGALLPTVVAAIVFRLL